MPRCRGAAVPRMTLFALITQYAIEINPHNSPEFIWCFQKLFVPLYQISLLIPSV